MVRCALCGAVCRPGENVNLVNYTEHDAVVTDLHRRLLDYIQLDVGDV